MAAALSTHLGDVEVPGPLVAAASARAGPLQQRDQLHGGHLGPGAGHVTRDTCCRQDTQYSHRVDQLRAAPLPRQRPLGPGQPHSAGVEAAVTWQRRNIL